MTRNRLLKTIIFGLVLAVSHSAAFSWTRTLHKKGITVYKKDAEGSSIKKMKATVTVNAPMSEVLAVLLDFKSYPKWHPNLVKFREYSKRETRSLIYFAYSLPFPVKNRDALMQQSLAVNNTSKTIVLTMKSRKDKRVPVKGDFVRIPNLYAKWSFKPSKSGNGTDITFKGHADMGGWVPAWLINWLASKRTLESVEKLRDRIKERKFDKGILQKYAFTQKWN